MWIEIISSNGLRNNFPIEDFRVNITRNQGIWELQRQETTIYIKTSFNNGATNLIDETYSNNLNEFLIFDLKIHPDDIRSINFSGCFLQSYEFNDLGDSGSYIFNFIKYETNQNANIFVSTKLEESHDWMKEGF